MGDRAADPSRDWRVGVVPELQLIRFDPETAQVWLNEHSLFAGVKLLLGRDPKRDYRDKVGEVRLDTH